MIRFAFLERLERSWPAACRAEVHVVVACSGGADSTALLRGLIERKPDGPGRLIVAHFNHRLRGDESDGDERFVGGLAARFDLAYAVGRDDVAGAAARQGNGIEAAAREARYRFLCDVAAQHDARYVVTAHTLDDQAETVLHRLLRGTGLWGLCGIPRARPLAGGAVGLLRPMLAVRRTEVLEYLAACEQPFRTDSSNRSSDYTRNQLRHDLLPRLARDYNPGVVEALARLATQAEEVRELLSERVEPLAAEAVVRADAQVLEIDRRPLVGVPRHLVREVFIAAWRRCGWPEQSMGFDDWDALVTLAIEDRVPPRMLPGGVVARMRDERLVLTR